MAQIGAGAGANDDIFAQDIAKNTNWSNFDLSKITNLTGDAGMIIPFDWFETIPKDKFKISAEVALESMPTITNMLTPYHVRTHWYYVRNSDLWAGFETMVTKGRTGNLNWTIPQVNPNANLRNDKLTFSVPHALQTFLGIPPKYGRKQSGTGVEVGKNYLPFGVATNSMSEYTETGYKNVTDGVSALPFMAYQAIVKYNYTDQNLVQDNHSLFPEEGDSDWRIPAKGNPTYINVLKYEDNQIKAKYDDNYTAGSIRGYFANNDEEVGLLTLRYAQYEDDAFTTALPWPQRGTAEELEKNIDLSQLNWGISERDNAIPIYIGADGTLGDSEANGIKLADRSLSNITSYYGSTYIDQNAQNFAGKNLTINARNIANQLKINVTGTATAGIAITANDLRKLIAMSVWQERNAQVNGSYNSMIWIHYKHNPNAQEHYPIYIGGTSDYIRFNEIMSTVETDENPQGTITSNGKMYLDQEVGVFNCPDYGIIMGILIITPMTTYNTTTQKEFFKKTAEDFYFPEFDNLGAMPILNKEIYSNGNAQTDNGLFGYAKNRYYWMKTRQNVNRGLFQMPSTYDETAEAKDSYFSAGTQAREFNGRPSLNEHFKTIDPIEQRRDFLAYPNEPMFKIQIASKIKAERPMAYNSQPETFGF